MNIYTFLLLYLMYINYYHILKVNFNIRNDFFKKSLVFYELVQFLNVMIYTVKSYKCYFICVMMFNIIYKMPAILIKFLKRFYSV